MRYAAACAGIAMAVAVGGDARAWEAETTHAGLAERAVLASSLGDRLGEHFDFDMGLYEPLAISPAEAPALFESLGLLNPTHGYVPDGDGEHWVLGWLVAGAVLADIPAAHAVHHAYDPLRGAGFSSDTLGASLGHRLAARAAGATLHRSGMAATEWLVHADNPLSLDRFLDQYEGAVAARSRAARSRHAAGMLLAAGGIVHVVQDTASPARARDDRAAMLRRIGRDRADAGSRFERLASLAFGRLGVPRAVRAIPLRPALRDYITTPEGEGLADLASRAFFSDKTLPRPIDASVDTRPDVLEERLRASLRRPHPRPSAALDLRRAASEEGARLLDASGVCLAQYALRDGELRWSIPDDCALEQAAALLAQASAYGAGVIDWLFRGELQLEERGGAIEVTSAAIGLAEVTVTLLAEDADGARAPVARIEETGGAAGEILARFDAAAAGEGRVVALVRGVDEHGEPIVATGQLSR